MRPFTPITEITWADLGSGIYSIQSPPVGFYQYLIVGEKKAVLVDTGIGIGSLLEKIREITDLPVQVILTHGHPDHAGGTAEFGECFINPADMDVYEKMASLEFRIGDISHMPGGEELAARLQPTGPVPTPLSDGQEIDLGGRTLKILFTPGHTHGSLCVIDSLTRAAFTGDNVQGREVAIREWNASPIAVYADSMRKLKAEAPSVCYSGHGPNAVSPENIDTYIAISEAILGGEKGEEQTGRNGQTSLVYAMNGVQMSYTEEKL